MENLSIIDERVLLQKNFRIYGTLENPLFLAKDVAEWIEHSDPSTMVRNIDDEEKVTNNVCTLGGVQKALFLTEDGLYEVLMQSRKPIAKQFKKEVKNILKTIRKTGSYSVQPKFQVPTTFSEALRLAADQQEQIEQQAKQLEAQKPKVEFFDAVADSKDAISMNEVAKVLAIKGMGRNNLFEFLRNEKILMSDNVPFQKYVDRGYFRVIEQKFMKNGEPCMNIKTLVYQKGVDFIRKTIEEQKTRQ